MRFLCCCLCLSCCLVAVAAEGDPPKPRPEDAPPLTEEQIKEAERLADAIVAEDRPKVDLTAEDKAAYELTLKEVAIGLAKVVDALKREERLEAGGHYVAARKAFTGIPKEVGPLLGPEYFRLARGLLAAAKVVLGPEGDTPAVIKDPLPEVPPGNPDGTAPAKDAPATPKEPAPPAKDPVTPATEKPTEPAVEPQE